MAVLVKEFIQLTRDRVTYAMILAVPVIQMLLFGYAINTDPRHLPTALLVQENSVFARSVVCGIAQYLLFRHHPPGAHRRPSSTGWSAPARSSSRSPSPATSPAAWCAATGRRSWSRPTPPTRPPPAAPSPPWPPARRSAAPRSHRRRRPPGQSGAAVRGRRPPPLQSGEHHRLQYRPRPARHRADPDPGDDDRDRRHPRAGARARWRACSRRRSSRSR